MINSVKGALRRLYRGRWGKVLPVLFVIALVATAGATVYVFFYTSGTAAARTPDVRLLAGPDISGSCTAYPCASGSVSSTHDILTVTLSFFPTVGGAPNPATYYSNFAQVTNTAASASHNILSVQVVGTSGTTADLGSITVYYCTTQTEFTASGTLATPANCVGSFAVTSGTLTGSLSGFSTPLAIASGGTQYIEVAAYAASGAVAGSSLTFQIAVQWV